MSLSFLFVEVMKKPFKSFMTFFETIQSDMKKSYISVKGVCINLLIWSFSQNQLTAERFWLFVLKSFVSDVSQSSGKHFTSVILGLCNKNFDA